MDSNDTQLKSSLGRRQFVSMTVSALAVSALNPDTIEALTTTTVKPAAKKIVNRDTIRLLVGTYTGGDSHGIYGLDFNRNTGQLEQLGLVLEAQQPSFLAKTKTGSKLFAVGETDSPGRKDGGSLTMFQMDGQSGLALVTRPTYGDNPCHVITNGKGNLVVVANYSGGSYTVFSIDGETISDGSCFQNKGTGPNTARQEGPHGHCVRFLPGDDRKVLAADLGTDQILLFEVVDTDKKPELKLISHLKMTPGAGPRQIDFHPSGKWFYVINELNSTMAQVSMPNDTGEMKILSETSTLPEDFTGNNSTAHLQVHPSGKFLYGSNRGHDSIAIFSIDGQSGQPKLVSNRKTEGKTPRHFLVESSGKFLLAANQDSDSVVVFPINMETGLLEDSQFQAYAPRPVCLLQL